MRQKEEMRLKILMCSHTWFLYLCFWHHLQCIEILKELHFKYSLLRRIKTWNISPKKTGKHTLQLVTNVPCWKIVLTSCEILPEPLVGTGGVAGDQNSKIRLYCNFTFWIIMRFVCIGKCKRFIRTLRLLLMRFAIHTWEWRWYMTDIILYIYKLRENWSHGQRDRIEFKMF